MFSPSGLAHHNVHMQLKPQKLREEGSQQSYDPGLACPLQQYQFSSWSPAAIGQPEG